MKVVFAHTDFRIYWPARLNTLREFLAQKGISLNIIEIAGKGSPYSFAEFTNVDSLYWHILFKDQRMEKIPPEKANKALRRKLDEIMPDIVFAGAIAFPSGAAAVLWAGENKKKVVIFDDARLLDTPRPGFVNYVKKSIYKYVDAILTSSSTMNETYKFFGFNDEQIFHGVTVVDNSFWQNGVEEKNDLLPEKYFLTVSRQIPKKNLMYLLKAYNNYTRSVPDPIGLVLVGEGPERAALEDFVKESQLQKVLFLPFLAQKELRKIYRNASCFILPSLFGETWGLTVNEAMASGLPVIVSDKAGCASTLVRNNINGFVFSPDDTEELTVILINLHNMSENIVKQMGKKSQEIISNWGLEKFCSGVIDALEFVSSHDQKRPGGITRLLVRIWKGRYRPT